MPCSPPVPHPQPTSLSCPPLWLIMLLSTCSESQCLPPISTQFLAQDPTSSAPPTPGTSLPWEALGRALSSTREALADHCDSIPSPSPHPPTYSLSLELSSFIHISGSSLSSPAEHTTQEDRTLSCSSFLLLHSPQPTSVQAVTSYL